jgi:hypothetical protein
MRVSGLSWGIVFIGCGIFWLAINAGYLDHYVWIKLLSLWPMALIAIGIIFIFKRTRLKFLTLLAPLLLALTFIYVGASEWGGSYGYYYRGTPDYGSRYSREVFKYTLDKDPEVEKLDFSMDFGLGELWIGGTSDKLFDGDFEYRTKKPRVDYDLVHGEGRLRVISRDFRGFNIFRHRNIKNDSRVFIADYLPLALDLDIGAARVDLDLSDEILNSLKLSTGAAEINLRLGCKSDNVQIDINAGASDIYITVPRDMALEIDSDATLSKTNFKSAGLTKEGGKYRTDNFGTAACTAYLNLDSGVSKITVGYY